MQKSSKNKFIEPNTFVSGLLEKLFAGQYSATRNLLQFLYFSYYLFPEDGEIYFITKKIVEDELLCHKMLAENIVFLGNLPQYKSCKNLLFSMGVIEYPRSINQMISLAVEIKENYIIQIKNVLQKIKNKQILADLLKILDINQKHMQLLSQCKL